MGSLRSEKVLPGRKSPYSAAASPMGASPLPWDVGEEEQGRSTSVSSSRTKEEDEIRRGDSAENGEASPEEVVREADFQSLYWRPGGMPPRTIAGKTADELAAEEKKRQQEEKKEQEMRESEGKDRVSPVAWNTKWKNGGTGTVRSLGSDTPGFGADDMLMASPFGSEASPGSGKGPGFGGVGAKPGGGGEAEAEEAAHTEWVVGSMTAKGTTGLRKARQNSVPKIQSVFGHPESRLTTHEERSRETFSGSLWSPEGSPEVKASDPSPSMKPSHDLPSPMHKPSAGGSNATPRRGVLKSSPSVAAMRQDSPSMSPKGTGRRIKIVPSMVQGGQASGGSMEDDGGAIARRGGMMMMAHRDNQARRLSAGASGIGSNSTSGEDGRANMMMFHPLGGEDGGEGIASRRQSSVSISAHSSRTVSVHGGDDGEEESDAYSGFEGSSVAAGEGSVGGRAEYEVDDEPSPIKLEEADLSSEARELMMQGAFSSSLRSVLSQGSLGSFRSNRGEGSGSRSSPKSRTRLPPGVDMRILYCQGQDGDPVLREGWFEGRELNLITFQVGRKANITPIVMRRPGSAFISTWSISPPDSVPAGMAFNESTGELEGTPTESGSERECFVSVILDSEGVTPPPPIRLRLRTAGKAPVLNAPTKPVTLKVGVHMEAIRLLGSFWDVSMGLEFTSDTNLPPGIRLDPKTGEVYGVPSDAFPLTAFTIRYSSLLGEHGDASLTIEVVSPPKGFAYNSKCLLRMPMGVTSKVEFRGTLVLKFDCLCHLQVDKLIASKPYKFTVSPPFPRGVSLDPDDGEITARPLPGTNPASTHKVFVTNAYGSCHTVVSLWTDPCRPRVKVPVAQPTLHFTHDQVFGASALSMASDIEAYHRSTAAELLGSPAGGAGIGVFEGENKPLKKAGGGQAQAAALGSLRSVTKGAGGMLSSRGSKGKRGFGTSNERTGTIGSEASWASGLTDTSALAGAGGEGGGGGGGMGMQSSTLALRAKAVRSGSPIGQLRAEQARTETAESFVDRSAGAAPNLGQTSFRSNASALESSRPKTAPENRGNNNNNNTAQGATLSMSRQASFKGTESLASRLSAGAGFDRTSTDGTRGTFGRVLSNGSHVSNLSGAYGQSFNTGRRGFTFPRKRRQKRDKVWGKNMSATRTRTPQLDDLSGTFLRYRRLEVDSDFNTITQKELKAFLGRQKTGCMKPILGSTCKRYKTGAEREVWPVSEAEILAFRRKWATIRIQRWYRWLVGKWKARDEQEAKKNRFDKGQIVHYHFRGSEVQEGLKQPGDLMWRTKAHPGGVACIMLNGARIITGGADKVVREWDAASSKGIRSFATCPASVGGFSKDKGGADGSEKKRGGKGTLMISAHVAPITGVCISVLGDRMFSCSLDRTVRVWDIASGNSVQQIRGGGNMFTSVCQSHKHLLICGTTDRFALAFHQGTGAVLRRYRPGGGGEPVVDVCTHGGKLFTAGGRDPMKPKSDTSAVARAYDIESGDVLAQFAGHSNVLTSVSLVSDELILTSSADATCRLWDVRNGRQVRLFKGHSGPVNAASACEAKNLLISGGADKTVRAFDIGTSNQILNIHRGKAHVEAIAMSQSGDYAYAGFSDGFLNAWACAGLTEGDYLPE